jgi:hypothetical protein
VQRDAAFFDGCPQNLDDVIADILWVFPGISEERLEALPLDQLLKRHGQAVDRKQSDRNALIETMTALLGAMTGR